MNTYMLINSMTWMTNSYKKETSGHKEIEQKSFFSCLNGFTSSYESRATPCDYTKIRTLRAHWELFGDLYQNQPAYRKGDYLGIGRGLARGQRKVKGR